MKITFHPALTMMMMVVVVAVVVQVASAYAPSSPLSSWKQRKNQHPPQSVSQHDNNPPLPSSSSSSSLMATTSSSLTTTRRDFFSSTVARSNVAIVSSCILLFLTPMPVQAAAASKTITNNPLEKMKDVQTTLGTLLENWQRATVDCTYADVPRELLEAKNKELLLEKASTYALFDKSVSVETCKTTNRIVRDYLGVTGKGPLVGIDKVLRQGLDLVSDVDNLDEYVTELESFLQSYREATSLSYTAGIADFDSVNNFEKQDVYSGNSNSNLNQAKAAIANCKSHLDRMIVLLQ